VSLMEVIVAERLAEARAAAAQERVVQALRLPRPPLRVIVGARLVALGERLLDSPRGDVVSPVPAREPAWQQVLSGVRHDAGSRALPGEVPLP
jgi:hypothetical protein